MSTQFEIGYHRKKTDTSEQFFLYLLSSCILVERYDFLNILMQKLPDPIDLDKDPEIFNSLEDSVSKNFLGNMWRLCAYI